MIQPWQGRVLPLYYIRINLVDRRGVEPRTSACKADVFPAIPTAQISVLLPAPPGPELGSYPVRLLAFGVNRKTPTILSRLPEMGLEVVAKLHRAHPAAMVLAITHFRCSSKCNASVQYLTPLITSLVTK